MFGISHNHAAHVSPIDLNGGRITQRILVIDDDVNITNTLKRGLAYEGFAVDAANSSRHGLTLAREHPPDLVILDIMLPDLDGFEVLKRLREADPGIPILMLTGRDGPDDQVKGLEQGADDYVVKPFVFETLAARVKAILRRRAIERPEVLRFADLSLDTGLQRARRGARDIDLTATEYEVLRQFMLRPKRILPKHFLMDRVWGYPIEGSSNVVEVYVKQLRQKLEVLGEPRLIHTFRGAGYVLREP